MRSAYLWSESFTSSGSIKGVEYRYRYWYGPVVGMVVTQVWQGFAARLFLSFGSLKTSTPLPKGSPGRLHGAFELTNMDSLSDWDLVLNGRSLATSESSGEVRWKRLQFLVGRRLLNVQIDQRSRSTGLSFTRDLMLFTRPMPKCVEQRPHWLLRLSREEWPPVILNGTSSRWQGLNGYGLPAK